MDYTDFRIKEVLQEVVSFLSQVSDRVFTSRPQTVPEQMGDFLLVGISGKMRPSVYGGGYGRVQSRLVISVYVRNRKGGEEDMDTMDARLSAIVSAMPMDGVMSVVSNPSIVMRGTDGTGFSSALVLCDLTTR